MGNTRTGIVYRVSCTHCEYEYGIAGLLLIGRSSMFGRVERQEGRLLSCALWASKGITVKAICLNECAVLCNASAAGRHEQALTKRRQVQLLGTPACFSTSDGGNLTSVNPRCTLQKASVVYKADILKNVLFFCRPALLVRH